MTDKVMMTIDDLKAWATVSHSRGTEHAFIGVALQWAEEAEKELQRLNTELAEAVTALPQAVRNERERIRAHFLYALADKGVTWPGEVDILYDKCFAAPYVPDEDV